MANFLCLCEWQIARVFQRTYGRILKDGYLIPISEDGISRLRYILLAVLNRECLWPSILGSATSLPYFWMGRDPQRPTAAEIDNEPELMRDFEALKLAPLRMLSSNAGVYVLVADMR